MSLNSHLSCIGRVRLLVEKMSETAIHGVEREKERGRGEKVGCGCLIRCFSLYVIWCDNPRCLILIDRHKGTGLHQLLIEVILLSKTTV
jgi:hypothetical protein